VLRLVEAQERQVGPGALEKGVVGSSVVGLRSPKLACHRQSLSLSLSSTCPSFFIRTRAEKDCLSEWTKAEWKSGGSAGCSWVTLARTKLETRRMSRATRTAASASAGAARLARSSCWRLRAEAFTLTTGWRSRDRASETAAVTAEVTDTFIAGKNVVVIAEDIGVSSVISAILRTCASN
jgi:hypothetical protein